MNVGKAPHHAGNYHVQAQRVRDAANADPYAICWRDGLTLAQHPPHADGSRPTWTAGHTIMGAANSQAWLNVRQRPPVGAWLAPDASVCNYADNGTHRKRQGTTRDW